MATLTKLERVLRTVRREETDRVPIYDLLQNQAVIEHYSGEPLTVANGPRLMAVTIGRTMDMTRSPGSGPNEPGIVRQVYSAADLAGAEDDVELGRDDRIGVGHVGSSRAGT